MSISRIMAGLLAISIALAALSHSGSGTDGHVIRAVFLYGLPLLLIGLLLTQARWALMAGVMYGTVGLALDISTAVQDLTKTGAEAEALLMSGVSGLVNFLLIVLGGRGFLDVQTATTRPISPHPNPPSRPKA